MTRLALLSLCAVAAGGCAAHRAFPVRAAATYEIATVASLGPQTVSQLYALETAAAGPRTWIVRTAWTDSSWEDAAGPVSFDSRDPRPADPPLLRTQQAVAAVAGEIAFDASGRPDHLVQPERWRSEAGLALDALGLPRSTRQGADGLVDPEGLVRDVARTFPGTPEQTWVRSLTLGEVAVARHERCELTIANHLRTWTCRGPVTAPDDAGVIVHEAESWTTAVIDRRGLLSLEEGWSGTLVHQHPSGPVVDEPFAAHRLVQRRD